MGDLKSSRLIKLKGVLFLVLGFASALLLLEAPTLKVAALLGIAVWSFCRFYHLLGLLDGRLEMPDQAVDVAILGLDVARALDQLLDLGDLAALENVVDGRAIEDSARIKQPEEFFRASVPACRSVCCPWFAS